MFFFLNPVPARFNSVEFLSSSSPASEITMEVGKETPVLGSVKEDARDWDTEANGKNP
jgi:hypothetical protein